MIDPGLEPEAILAFLDEQQLTVAAILNTHGHADHIAGNEAMKKRYPASAAPHRRQRSGLADRCRSEPERPVRLADRQPAGRSDRVRRGRAGARRHSPRGARDSGAFAGARRLRGARDSRSSSSAATCSFAAASADRFPRRQLRAARRRHPHKAVHAAGRYRRLSGARAGDDKWGTRSGRIRLCRMIPNPRAAREPVAKDRRTATACRSAKPRAARCTTCPLSRIAYDDMSGFVKKITMSREAADERTGIRSRHLLPDLRLSWSS